MSELSVKDVAISLCKGNIKEKYGRTEDEGNELLRRSILKTAGCENGWDPYLFRHNQHLVFKLLSEVLEETVGEQLMEKYESWVDFRSVALGDTIEFKVPNKDLFEVGIVADGTDNLRRQRILHGKIAMQSFQLGAKIYEEFLMFQMGRIDFADMINRVARSVDNALMRIIVKAIENAYVPTGSETFGYAGTYSDDEVLRVCENVEAKTGIRPVIYGAKGALANLRKSSAALWSDAEKEEVRRNGHVGLFNGYDVIEIPNFMDNKDQLVLKQNILFVIPDGTKIIKLLNEGNAEVFESTDQHARLDNQIEYQFMMRYQLGILKSNVYGVVIISNN